MTVSLDDEIEPQPPVFNVSPEVLALAVKMRRQLDDVRNAPLPPEQALPSVAAKTLERIDAFSTRQAP
jgi:hypothetical protein